MGQYTTVGDILNRSAVELGFDEVINPLVTANKAFIQLRSLMNSAAEELIDMAVWSDLVKEHSFTTAVADTGTYSLPDDFRFMIPQTNWDRTGDRPIVGPLSPQRWQYLKSGETASSTIYLSFRIKQQQFVLFPDDPVPTGIEVVFEYMSDLWIEKINEDMENERFNEIQSHTDLCLLPKTIMIKFLKVKFLEAKGFASDKAREDFAVNFFSATGHTQSAPVLNAGRGGTGFSLINHNQNVPNTGYGYP